ncbi:cyclase family protein [Pikeienuella sp. HZG-20]|uniref:cyclase family protein n=1 Tax=Paludibacillus litoralis TaxID=3133267 RepID=UPI0030EED6C4
MTLTKILTFAAAAAFAFQADAQGVNDKPLTENWAPSEWGADDTAGSVNRTTPEMVMKAVGLVKQGKVATLGKIYAGDAPNFGSRVWRMTIPGLPTGGPYGDHQLVYNDEYLAAEIGQIGTQFDGPGHIGVITSKGTFFYNGRILEDDPSINAYGMGPLGVEHVADKGFVCRGVLLDAVAYKGGQLPIPKGGVGDPGIVSDADVKAMIEAQGVAPLGEGDCVFLYTGHGDLWHPTNWDTFDAAEKARRAEEFKSGEPGFGLSACEYMAERKIILTGADTWATEAVPGENPGDPFECHLNLQTKRGVWNIENLDLSQLVADKAYEFLFVWSPLKMKGATGSPGNPIALY